MIDQIGLGGGCHWCTEGVFQSLIGIEEVKQGWISSKEKTTFSEAVLITFDTEIISIKDLIEIHLFTHASTSSHSFREKYRSSVYTFSENQKKESEAVIQQLQAHFEEEIITKVLTFNEFKLNKEDQLNYLYSRKDNQFCTRYIHPKLSLLMSRFSDKVNKDKLQQIESQN
jgi:peptide-methionine (S)-S-oxide reductase